MSKRNKNDNRPAFRKPSFTQPRPHPELEKKYYDNADMMQLFKVSSRTLQRWRDEGIVPFKKLGGKIYYLSQKVDELMEDNNENDR